MFCSFICCRLLSTSMLFLAFNWSPHLPPASGLLNSYSFLRSHLIPPFLRETLPDSFMPQIILITQTVTTKLVQVTAKSRVSFWLDPGLKKCHQDLIIFSSLGHISLVLVPKRSSSFMLRRLQWLQLPSSPSNLGGRVDILLQGDSNKCPRI